MNELYYTYKDYLMKRHGEKTYKVPLNFATTCPNRDGKLGRGGCYFCSPKGTGFEGDTCLSLTIQWQNVVEKMEKRYHPKKYIAYFQNYTTTYMPLEEFMRYINEVLEFPICGIDIATRPDSLPEKYLIALSKIQKDHDIDITFELGLQIANDKILQTINRGHTVADYIDTCQRIKSYGFSIATHLILNLPESTNNDVLTTVKLINSVHSDSVKLHSLYIAKGSVFEKWYHQGKITLGTPQEYIERVLLFLTHLDPSIAVSRLVSRIPKEDSVFSNWNLSWWKIYNTIQEQMREKNLYQGIFFNHKG